MVESDQGARSRRARLAQSVAGAAPGRGPRGALCLTRRPGSGQAPTAAGGGVPRGEIPAKAIAPVVADQGSNSEADTIKKVQAATVYLKVQAGRLRGSGTGFVIQSAGNTVLVATNDHVVNPHLEGLPRNDDSSRSQPQPTIVAVFQSGARSGVEQSLSARIIAADRDEKRDLAILEVQGVKDPPHPIAISDAALPARLMPLVICGFPFGNIDPCQAEPQPIDHRQPGLGIEHDKRSIQPACTHPDRWVA